MLGFVFLLGCCVAVADAQASGSETRARRAAAATSSAKEADDSPAQMNDVTTNASSSEQGKDDSDAAPANSKETGRVDRISLLRSQIQGAKTELERVRLQRTLVDYLVALNRQSEAVAELRSMLDAENLDAASYYNIGNGLARLGDAEHAVEGYHKAIDMRQGNYPRALNNLGVVLLELDRLDEAYDAFVLAIKQQNFRYAEASYNLGKLYAARDEAELAISEWTRALSVQPDHVDAAVALARAYAVTGKPDRGLEVIDATLKRTGANAKLEAARDEISAMSKK
ncbi:MAG TPA: BTAD domain-containing putative transcriptional regulator [Pyrinomonadaceae bacterium]